MKNIDQIIHARWIITCEPNTPVLENQALVIDQGKIQAIIPSNLVADSYSAKTTSQYEHHALLPGFVNSHTHLPMNYFRGLADDVALMNWLNNYIWPAEKKWVSENFVYDASLFAMAEMIRSGSICFNDMYFFPKATARAAELAGIRAHIGMTIIEFPTNWAQTTDDYFARGLEFYEEYKKHPLIKATIAPHAPYTVSDASFERIQVMAEKYDLKINLHLQESKDEITQSLETFNMRPIARLNQLGLLTPRLIAIHMANLNDEDLAILQKTQPSVVHCPESNMKLASGACPVEKLRALGINVALGTDGVASNNDLDMIGEMRTAAFLGKLITENPEALSAETVLAMATLNGAKALGTDKITGSLSAGKSADFIAMNLTEIETMPVYHPISQMVYAGSRHQVTDVWVAGKQLMKNRVLTTLDEKEIKAKAVEWSHKIS